MTEVRSLIPIPLPEDQPLMLVWPDVGRALGIGRTKTYAMLASGDFPLDVIWLGRGRMCRTADVRRYLGLPVPVPS